MDQSDYVSSLASRGYLRSTNKKIIKKVRSSVVFFNQQFWSNQDTCEHDKLIVEIYKNNIEYVKSICHEITDYTIKFDCIIIACSFSQNTQFIDNIKKIFDIKYVDGKIIEYLNNTILMYGCKNNIIQMSEHLLKGHVTSIRNVNSRWIDSLYYVCEHISNIDLIIYLYKIYKKEFPEHDATLGTTSNKTALTYLLMNEHIGVKELKYMIENEIINIKENDRLISGLSLLTPIMCKRNINIIMYIYENTNFDTILNKCSKNIEYLNIVIKYIPVREKVDKLLVAWFIEYAWRGGPKKPPKFGNHNDFLKVIKTINPLFLEDGFLNLINENNPYKRPFNEWRVIVDELIFSVPIKNLITFEKNVKDRDGKQSCKELNESKKELLFFCNKIPYYGDKKIVHGSIMLLKDMGDCFDSTQPIELSGSMDQKLMDLYLDSIYTKQFNGLLDIEPENIFRFLDFIDRYPTEILSIGSLDHQLTNYFSTKKLDPSPIKEIIIRYGLKFMYLCAHNYTVDKYNKEN